MSYSFSKEMCGGRRAFHDCIGTGGPIAFGAPSDVVANCREILEDHVMPGGGYCLSPICQQQDSSLIENLVALY